MNVDAFLDTNVLIYANAQRPRGAAQTATARTR